jgi:hypothetical protein
VFNSTGPARETAQFQVQDLLHPEEAQDASNPARDGLVFLTEGEDPRPHQVDRLSSMDEPAAALGGDVLHPVNVASVAESDYEAVLVRERRHGRSVEESGRTTPVDHDAEEGKPPSHRPERGVGNPAIETGQPSARSQPVLRAAFLAPGVAEAILTEGVVQVRLGRLFAWDRVEEAVRKALRSFAP